MKYIPGKRQSMKDLNDLHCSLSVEKIEELLLSCEGLFELSHFDEARRGYTQIYEILNNIDLVERIDSFTLNSFKRRVLLNSSSCCVKLCDWSAVLNTSEQLLKCQEIMPDEGTQEWSSIMYFKAYSLKKVGRLGQSFVAISKLVSQSAAKEFLTFRKELKIELQERRKSLNKGSTGEEILRLAVGDTDYFNAAQAYLRVAQSTSTPDEEAIRCIKKAIDICDFSHLHRIPAGTTTIQTDINTTKACETERSPSQDNKSNITFTSASADEEIVTNDLDDSTNSTNTSSSISSIKNGISNSIDKNASKSREHEVRWKLIAGVAYSLFASRLLANTSFRGRQEDLSVLQLLRRAYDELIEPWQSLREEAAILHLVSTLRDISQIMGKQTLEGGEYDVPLNNRSNLSLWSDSLQVLLEALQLMDEYVDHYCEQNNCEYGLSTLSSRMTAVLLQRARLQREIADIKYKDCNNNPNSTEIELWDLAAAADLLWLQDLDAVCIQLRKVAQRWERCDNIESEFNLSVLSTRWLGKSSDALIGDSSSAFNNNTIDRRRRNVDQFFTKVFSFTKNEVSSNLNLNSNKLDYLLETDLCYERVRRTYLTLANVSSERIRKSSMTSDTKTNTTVIEFEVGISLMRAGHCALSLADAESCYTLAKSKLKSILSIGNLGSRNSHEIKILLVDVHYHLSYSLQLQGRIEEALEEVLSGIEILHYSIMSNTNTSTTTNSLVLSKKSDILKRLWLLRGQVAVCMAALAAQNGWTSDKNYSTLQSLRVFTKHNPREALPPAVLHALEQLEQSDLDSVMDAIGAEMDVTTAMNKDNEEDNDSLDTIHIQIVEDSWQRVQSILEIAIQGSLSHSTTDVGSNDPIISNTHDSNTIRKEMEQTINTNSNTESGECHTLESNTSIDPVLLFVAASLMAICFALLVAPRLNKWALQQQKCMQDGSCPNT